MMRGMIDTLPNLSDAAEANAEANSDEERNEQGNDGMRGRGRGVRAKRQRGRGSDYIISTLLPVGLP